MPRATIARHGLVRKGASVRRPKGILQAQQTAPDAIVGRDPRGRLFTAGRHRVKREYRALWITRITAACRMRGISYSRFMHGWSRPACFSTARCSANWRSRTPLHSTSWLPCRAIKAVPDFEDRAGFSPALFMRIGRARLNCVDRPGILQTRINARSSSPAWERWVMIEQHIEMFAGKSVREYEAKKGLQDPVSLHSGCAWTGRVRERQDHRWIHHRAETAAAVPKPRKKGLLSACSARRNRRYRQSRRLTGPRMTCWSTFCRAGSRAGYKRHYGELGKMLHGGSAGW